MVNSVFGNLRVIDPFILAIYKSSLICCLLHLNSHDQQRTAAAVRSGQTQMILRKEIRKTKN